MATHLTLVNQQTGELALKISHAAPGENPFDHLCRFPYYSLLWVRAGTGTLRANLADYPFGPDQLLCFNPYQPFRLHAATADLLVSAVQFHADFFCILKHHAEVACNGVLFNNIYQSPVVPLDAAVRAALAAGLALMETELRHPALAQHELLVAQLKILLIQASRLKRAQHPEVGPIGPGRPGRPAYVLQQLRDHIEAHYRTTHRPAAYADLVRLTPKALGRLTRQHLHQTPSELIQERLFIEAKRELYLTDKPVQQIAWELGFTDEFYFSRLFKRRADVSPTQYRQTVGFARGGVPAAGGPPPPAADA